MENNVEHYRELIKGHLEYHIFQRTNKFKSKTLKGQNEELTNMLIESAGDANLILDQMSFNSPDLIIEGPRSFNFFNDNGIPFVKIDEDFIWRPIKIEPENYRSLLDIMDKYDIVTQCRINDLCWSKPTEKKYMNKFIQWDDIKKFKPVKYEFFWDLIFKRGIKFTIQIDSHSDKKLKEFRYYLRKANRMYEKKMLITPEVYSGNIFMTKPHTYTFYELITTDKVYFDFEALMNQKKEDNDEVEEEEETTDEE